GGPAGSATLTPQPLENARPDHLDIRRTPVAPLPQLHAGLPVRRHRLGHVLPGGLIGRHVLARLRVAIGVDETQGVAKDTRRRDIGHVYVIVPGVELLLFGWVRAVGDREE